MVTADSITLRGTVLDDVAVKDLYVFVRDGATKTEQKVTYERLSRPVAEHAFTLQLPLKPGVNEIEIYSRDEQDLRGSLSLGLYRETVTAARESEGGATR